MGSVGNKARRSQQRGSSGVHSGFFLSGGNTLEQVMVKRLVGCQDSRHLIMVRRMDILIDAVACELHLTWKGRGEESGIFSRTLGRWGGRR